MVNRNQLDQPEFVDVLEGEWLRFHWPLDKVQAPVLLAHGDMDRTDLLTHIGALLDRTIGH